MDTEHTAAAAKQQDQHQQQGYKPKQQTGYQQRYGINNNQNHKQNKTVFTKSHRTPARCS